MQQAYHEQHGLQCGYCTPGLLLATVDLLERNPIRARPRSASTWRATSAVARATSASSRRCRRLPGSSEEGPDGGDRDGGPYVGRRIPASRMRGSSAGAASTSTTSSCPGRCTRRSSAARSRTRGSPAWTPARAGARRRRARAHRRGRRRHPADRHGPPARGGRGEQPSGAARREGSLRRRGRRVRHRDIPLRG